MSWRLRCLIGLHPWETIFEYSVKKDQRCPLCGATRHSCYDMTYGGTNWVPGLYWSLELQPAYSVPVTKIIDTNSVKDVQEIIGIPELKLPGDLEWSDFVFERRIPWMSTAEVLARYERNVEEFEREYLGPHPQCDGPGRAGWRG